MNPWTLVNAELRTSKKDWQWLADALEMKIQRVNHWEARGIPAKHHNRIEDILGKPRGWITGDAVQFTPPSHLSPAAIEIAVLFDMIPASDKIRRAQAFNGASDIIIAVLQSFAANGKTSPDQKKPRA